jgi:uncharacterized membrane protein YoaK (UPF0700 family)
MASNSKYAGLGIALGAALGTVFGVIAGHIAVWLALGVAIGVAIGASIRPTTPNCHECAQIHLRHEIRNRNNKLEAES